MPNGNGQNAEKIKGRSLDNLSAVKKNIVVVKAAFLCLAHALITAIVNCIVNGDPKYKSYRNGYGFEQPVEEILEASGVDLSDSGSLQGLQQFQEHLSVYKMIVYDGLSPNRLIFSGNSFRIRNCTYHMMRIRIIIMCSPTLNLQWQM
jgi:hypothetical protein